MVKGISLPRNVSKSFLTEGFAKRNEDSNRHDGACTQSYSMRSSSIA